MWIVCRWMRLSWLHNRHRCCGPVMLHKRPNTSSYRGIRFPSMMPLYSMLFFLVNSDMKYSFTFSAISSSSRYKFLPLPLGGPYPLPSDPLDFNVCIKCLAFLLNLTRRDTSCHFLVLLIACLSSPCLLYILVMMQGH